jgi:hypothetical protein
LYANHFIAREPLEDKMTDSQTKPSRRGFFFGAAATGAAVAAVVALPGGVARPEAKLQPLPPAPEKGGGYSLSEHVKRYYKTTRV